MRDILYQIITHKTQEVEKQKKIIDSRQLREGVDTIPPCRPFSRALLASSSGIIAEFKRKSPSKGWIHQEADVANVIRTYETGGAAAISILTDEAFFGGTLSDLRRARTFTELPLLRKDFIIDPYQLLQARIVGADAVLLIAAALTRVQCTELAHYAHTLGLEVLLEVHSEEELSYINPHIDMVGVNNRCLGTFDTDVETSLQLASLLPRGLAHISESGLRDADQLHSLRQVGYSGFLIGETLMGSPDPAYTLRTFRKEVEV